MGASNSTAGSTPADTLVVHGGLERGPLVPSVSPFVMKLETYLRVAGIKYEFTSKGGFGPKGKVPWIQYNEEKMGDSYFIMKHLNKKFDIDLDKKLSCMDKAIATAFRISIEEFLLTAFGLEFIAWNSVDNIKKSMNFPTPLIYYFKSRSKSNSKQQGIGRHSQEEVREITENIVKSISDLLGENPYMMGEDVSELDCTVFSVMTMLLYTMKDLYPNKLANDKYKNLVAYCERMKTEYWPDWDELILQSKKETTKQDQNGKTSDEK